MPLNSGMKYVLGIDTIMQNGHFSECLCQTRNLITRKKSKRSISLMCLAFKEAHLKKKVCVVQKIHPLKWVELNPTPWLARRGRNVLIMAISY